MKLTGKTFFDPLLAIVIALVIIHTAYRLMSQSTRFLGTKRCPKTSWPSSAAPWPSIAAS